MNIECDDMLDFHIVFRGNGRSDLFYSEREYKLGMNCLSISAAKYGVMILGFNFLSNHNHDVVRCSPSILPVFMKSYRVSLARTLNREQGSIGSVGGRGYKAIPIKDAEDFRDVICYVMRNPLRHKITNSFMNYPYSTVRLYFNDSQPRPDRILNDEKQIQSMLPVNVSLPSGYLMDKSGLILPQSYVKKGIVESVFGSKANYLQAIGRPSQREMNIEATDRAGKTPDLSYSDQDVIGYINDFSSLKLGKRNVKQMFSSDKKILIRYLKDNFPSIPVAQMGRILDIPLRTVYRWMNRH